MRPVALIAVGVISCVLVSGPAWSAHTSTPPGLPFGWGNAVTSSNDKVEPGTPQWTVGAGLVEGLNKGDLKALTNLVDVHAMAGRLVPGFRKDAEVERYVEDGFLGDTLRGILESYCRGVKGAHGTAKLLEIKMHAGQAHVRIRLDQGSLGLTYLEFVAEQQPEGDFRVVNWFELNDNRLLDEKLGPVARLAADLDDQTSQHKLFSSTRFSSAVADRIKRVGVLRSQGAYSKSLEAMSELPPMLAETLVMLEMRAKDARRANDMKEYYRVLGQIDFKYGSDPSLGLTLADYYIQNNQLSKAIAGVSSLESRIGVDGGTHLTRAHLFLEAKDYADAVSYARKAADLEPGLEGAWYCLAKSYVQLKNYPQAVVTYRSMQARFHQAFTRQTFVSDPEFSAFVQSADFGKWLPQ
jgi:hypothetical protein